MRFYLRYCQGASPQEEKFLGLDAAVAPGKSLVANDNIWGVEVSDHVSRQVVFGSSRLHRKAR